MSGKSGLFLFAGVLLAVANAQIQTLTIPLCSSLNFSHTILPNRLGHKTQDEISRELAKFTLLADHACSGHFKTFLCSLHAPLCNSPTCHDIVHDPCRDLCLAAKEECEPVMSKLGFSYPEAWRDCKRFPVSGTCLVKDQSNSSVPTSNEAPDDSSSSNEFDGKKDSKGFESAAVLRNSNVEIKEPEKPKSWGVWLNITMCQGVGYYFTKLPNRLGQDSQMKINEKLDRLLPLAESACTQDFRRFLCSLHARLCTSESCVKIIDGPCRNLCITARHGCERHLNRLGYDYPKNWGNCAQFPKSGNCMAAWDPPPPKSTTTISTSTSTTSGTTSATASTKPPRFRFPPRRPLIKERVRKLNTASAETIVKQLAETAERKPTRGSDDTSNMQTIITDLRKLIDRLERIVRRKTS